MALRDSPIVPALAQLSREAWPAEGNPCLKGFLPAHSRPTLSSSLPQSSGLKTSVNPAKSPSAKCPARSGKNRFSNVAHASDALLPHLCRNFYFFRGAPPPSRSTVETTKNCTQFSQVRQFAFPPRPQALGARTFTKLTIVVTIQVLKKA